MRKMRYLRFALVVSLCVCSSYAFSEIAFAQNQEEIEKIERIRVKEVRYFSGNRRDPFLSLIMKAEEEAKAQEREGKKSPIENFDLGQFKLIAILWDGERFIATVGLPDNKFYTIKQGMTIGLHSGKVFKISDESVIIREVLPDFRGELKPEDTVIKLHAEEEE